jgi:hypothetical protein
MQVIALIREDPSASSAGRYRVSFPDLPFTQTFAGTPDAAYAVARRELAAALPLMLTPPIRTLSELIGDPAFQKAQSGAMIALIPYDAPGGIGRPPDHGRQLQVAEPADRAVRINITLDGRLLNAVDRAAKSASKTRSAFLALAAMRLIGSGGRRAKKSKGGRGFI